MHDNLLAGDERIQIAVAIQITQSGRRACLLSKRLIFAEMPT
jgi:hypothetical protein